MSLFWDFIYLSTYIYMPIWLSNDYHTYAHVGSDDAQNLAVIIPCQQIYQSVIDMLDCPTNLKLDLIPYLYTKMVRHEGNYLPFLDDEPFNERN
jgi:hypothetical protein